MADNFGAEAFLVEAATVELFREIAGHFKILHLATHATADADNEDASHVSFHPSGSPANLFGGDIYNLTLSTEMVVLSTCESAIGKLYQGEGMMSLTYAFAFAGAKSIVSSLWKVEDKPTGELMILFYKYLDDGLSKDVALQQACLLYTSDAADE